MGMGPPPIYDGTERSKEAFRRWYLAECRAAKFNGACLAIGGFLMVLVFVLPAIVRAFQ